MFRWNSKQRALPQFMAEASGACDGGMMCSNHGLVSCTRIATQMGWRPVDAIAVGDLVLTFDNGLQHVTTVQRFSVSSDFDKKSTFMRAVHVPAGAVGNSVDLTVMADQGVMIESDAAMDEHGDPFAVLPAASLIGLRGIRQAALKQSVDVLTLSFAEDQVIYTEGNLMAHCPVVPRSLIDAAVPHPNYQVLSMKDARFLTECLALEDAGMLQAAC